MSDYASNPADLPRGTLSSLFFERIDRGGSDPIFRHFVDASDTLEELSVQETLEIVVKAAAGLGALGVQPGDRVAILSENRTEWALADFGCILARVPDVPIYDTLPAEQVAYILKDAGARTVFVSTRIQMEKALDAGREAQMELQVIVFEPGDGPLPDGVISWDALLARGGEAGLGAEHFREVCAEVDPEEIATLIYTSGTTGKPKGVMLTHRNLHSNVVAAGRVLEIGAGDVSMSFLPLSHVFQRMVDYLLFWRGCVLARAHDINTVASDFKVIRPTIEVSVPRLYEKVYNKVMAATGVKKLLVGWATGVGLRWADRKLAGESVPQLLHMQYALADRLVFRKIRDGVGGRMRFFVSGGAPLSPEIARFFFAVGLPIVEGYGLTETSPVTNVNPLEGIRIGSVGPPVPGTEIRIAEDGEILVRGPQVMKGYFNQPEATAEVIDEEGWFRTGDIGTLDPDGYLRITDRKKDMIVTAGGKNIAPQPIENRLKTHPLVEQVVMIGDRRRFCSLLIVPDFAVLEGWAAERGIAAGDRLSLLRNEQVQAAFAESLDDLDDLARYERPKKIGLLVQEFTIEDGTLTPTQKVKRRTVQERFKALIDELYLPENEDRTVLVVAE